jgi:hypothetical protein
LSQWASGGEFEIAETLTGTNFVTGATSVQVTRTTGITVVTEGVTSTTIRATFRIGRDVKPGTYLVTVTTAGGTSAQPFIVQSSATVGAAVVKSKEKKAPSVKEKEPPSVKEKKAPSVEGEKGSAMKKLKAFFLWFT